MNKLTGGEALVGRLRATDTITGKNITNAVTITVGTEESDVINVACQLNDGNGDPVAVAKALPFYLADDAAGQVPSATAPDSGIAVGTDGALIAWAADLSGLAIFEADGDLDVDIEESGAGTWYLVFVLPNGELAISDAITFAA